MATLTKTVHLDQLVGGVGTGSSSGTDADAYSSGRGPFPEPLAVLYMAEIVLALEYMHSRGIVYRYVPHGSVFVRLLTGLLLAET